MAKILLALTVFVLSTLQARPDDGAMAAAEGEYGCRVVHGRVVCGPL